MKHKSNISLGPGASSLILIFVVLSLSVLAMLSLMTSRNDLRLSERSAEVIEAVYELNEQAELKRAALDTLVLQAQKNGSLDTETLEALLPEDVSLDGDELSWVLSDGSRQLDCALQIQPVGEGARTRWIRHDLTAETEDEAWT